MLRDTPSVAVRDLLAGQSISPDRMLLCAATDIDLLGRYERQWLVATYEQLLVIGEGETPQVLLSLRFEEVTEFRCQSVVGSGLLQARIHGMFVDLLRFSNRLADPFQKIARKLDGRLRGRPIVVHEEDEVDPRRCPKCSLMLQFVGDVCPRCVSRGAVLLRMWRLFQPYRRMVGLMLSLLFVGILLDLVSPKLTQYLVDNVLPGSPEKARELQQTRPGWHRENLHILLIVVGILASVQLLRMCVNMINGRLGSAIGTALTADMRGRLVNHLQQLSLAFFDRQQIGSLVGRVAYDTEALHGFVQQLTGGFLFQLLMVIGVGCMMFSISVKLALWTLIPAPFVIFGSVLFWRYIYPRYYRFWDASSKQAGMLAGALTGIRVVKASCQEDREMERFNSVSERLKRSRRQVDFSTATFNPIMTILFQFGGWIVWYVGGNEVLTGQMTLGSLIAYFGYLWMFYGPLTILTQFTNWLTQFATQAHRIFEILDTPMEIVESAHPQTLQSVTGRIEFDNVSFGYNRHSPVLHDVKLDISPGEMIGIVGRSGSGKSTIVNLICRFYDVDEGRVLIDGIDVRDVQKDNLRRQIGVVLQEPFLFRGSIRQNIAYGLPDASSEAVIAAAKAANAHDFIMRSAHGYDTWVGERGSGLSGGERQRISIARVLLTDPRILILDEATSSVDAESEAAIQTALAEVVRGRTTIAIAHRLSTLRNAHRIVVVDQGVIVESGPHDELAAQGGLYAHLLKIQGQMSPPSIDRLSSSSDIEDDIQYTDESPLPHPKSHHPRWLTPDIAKIHIGNLRALHTTIRNEGIFGGVFALRCMPVNHPRQFISLRFLNSEKREIEIGLLRDLDDWPEEAMNLVEKSLMKRYFVHHILTIGEIDLYNGYLNIKAQTDLGPTEFMMRWQSDRAHDYGVNGKMLIDTEENRYLIPDLDKLPPDDRALFLRFIYW